MYKVKNEILKNYLDNNEPIEAQFGTTILISVEDVDIIIDRVVKNLILPVVSDCSLTELNMLKDVYTEREERSHSVKNHREAHEDSIRRGVIEHILAIVNNR